MMVRPANSSEAEPSGALAAEAGAGEFMKSKPLEVGSSGEKGRGEACTCAAAEALEDEGNGEPMIDAVSGEAAGSDG